MEKEAEEKNVVIWYEEYHQNELVFQARTFEDENGNEVGAMNIMGVELIEPMSNPGVKKMFQRADHDSWQAIFNLSRVFIAEFASIAVKAFAVNKDFRAVEAITLGKVKIQVAAVGPDPHSGAFN